MATTDKQYFAFISYRRCDQKWAQWLQDKLEHYKMPTNLNGKPNLPKEIRPVFRDKSELAAGVLANELQRALEQSKYLIVICSPNSAKSEWVNKEVQAFIDMGRVDKIIPFIIEGTAHSKTGEDECFPQALRDLPAENELLGVNINEMGRDAAAVKVVAHMFGVNFDDLWQRHEREKKRRRNIITTGIVMFVLGVICVSGWIYEQNIQLRRQRWKMRESQSKLVSEKIVSNADKDSYLGRMISLEILPKNMSNPVDWPYTAEAEFALREVSTRNSAVFKGHSEGVLSAVFSPDGKRLLSASWDSTLRIWDVNTGVMLETIQRDSWKNYGVTFSQDGKRIICANDSIINVLDTQTGAEIGSFVNEKKILSVAFMPDDKGLLVNSSDNVLRFIDIDNGLVFNTLTDICDYFSTAAISPDGKKIVCAPKQYGYCQAFVNAADVDFTDSLTVPVKIFDYQTGKELKLLKGHKYYVASAVFSPDGKYVLTASYDMTLKIWDAETGKELRTMKGNNSSFLYAEYSRDGKKIVSISRSTDKPVIIWDAATGEEIMTLAGHMSDVNSAHFDMTGKKVITASSDKTIRIWDIDDGSGEHILARNRNNSINWQEVISNDGRLLISTNDGHELVITNTISGKEMLSLQHESYVHCAAFSPDGSVVITSSDDMLHFWNTETGEEFRNLNRHTEGINALAFNPSGSRFVTTSYKDYKVKLWDFEKGEEMMELADFSSTVDDMVFSPDGDHIILSVPYYSDDIVIDSHTGEVLSVMTGHVAKIMRTVYSPDGKHVVTASFDFTLKVWDAATGKVLKTLTDPTDVVMDVAFSPDGKRIVAACGDNTVRVWDTETWKCVQVIKGHTRGVKFAAFTSDGREIISAAQDSTIRKWDFKPLQELIDDTRERFAERPLTDDDRESYYLE